MFFQSLISGLLTGGIYSLSGIGMALVFGVSGISNFSHGTLMMLAMFITYYLQTLLGVDPYLSLFVVIPVMFGLGVLLQKTLISKIQDKAHEAQILMTIGVGLILSNLAMLAFTADCKNMTSRYSSLAYNLTENISISIPLSIAFSITIAITAVLFWFLNHTYTGLALRATSQNRESAKLMGIDIKRMGTLSFGLGTALAGTAGTLLMPTYYVSPEVGHDFLLKCFVVCVLGGLGSIPGALVAGIVIGVVEAMASSYASSAWSAPIVYSVFLAVLLIRPAGLFGKSGK